MDGIMNNTIIKLKNGDFEVVNTSYNINVYYTYVK